ncbi:hypothetical protein AAF712_016886, partial [Marasmius tenuissimus]
MTASSSSTDIKCGRCSYRGPRDAYPRLPANKGFSTVYANCKEKKRNADAARNAGKSGKEAKKRKTLGKDRS